MLLLRATAVALVAASCAPPASAQNQAVRFDGSNYLVIPNHPDLSPEHLTVELWFTPRGPGAGQTGDSYGAFLAGKPRQGGSGDYLAPWAIYYAPSTGLVTAAVASGISGPGVTIRSRTPVAIGDRAHAALVFAGDEVRLYLHGELEASAPYAHGPLAVTSNDILLGAANFVSPWLRRFDGEIEEFHLFAEARSDERILHDTFCGVAASEPALIASYLFENDLEDRTAGNHDASAVGTVPFTAVPNSTTDRPPEIVAHPADASPCIGGSATFEVAARGPSLTYQWLKDGAPLSGETGPSLTFAAVNPGNAGSYTVAVTGSCGGRPQTVVSTPAVLTLCPANFNCDDAVDASDITAFLNAWFADRAGGTTTADFNVDGIVDASDITTFLGAWFDARAEGC